MGYKPDDITEINKRLDQAAEAGYGFTPELGGLALRFFVVSNEPFVTKPFPNLGGVFAEEMGMRVYPLVGFSPLPRWDDDHAGVVEMGQSRYGIRCEENMIAEAADYVAYYPDRAVFTTGDEA